jgi:hypothetical protein
MDIFPSEIINTALMLPLNTKSMESPLAEIAKEEIGQLRFPANDVLNSESERDQRRKDLEQALTLGNLEHIKFKIYFEDDQAKRFVHTTIWGLTDRSVILKGGMTIPMHRIRSIV